MRRFVETEPAIDRINVTPIIDVALVLVIILLMTAPLLSAPELEVKLPEARTRGAEDNQTITVTMDADGHIAVDEETIIASRFRAELRERLAEPGRKGNVVIVRADESLPHVKVRSILAQAKEAGAQRIAIAANQKAGR